MRDAVIRIQSGGYAEAGAFLRDSHLCNKLLIRCVDCLR